LDSYPNRHSPIDSADEAERQRRKFSQLVTADPQAAGVTGLLRWVSGGNLAVTEHDVAADQSAAGADCVDRSQQGRRGEIDEHLAIVRAKMEDIETIDDACG